MTEQPTRVFVGRGPVAGSCRHWCTEQLAPADAAAWMAQGRLDDPADYEADPGLVDAMNVALLLGRPLLLTGRPGTGKSQFADRVAWEFDLAPVLRFEAKSVSEAQDLFYRYDMVGRVAASQSGSLSGLQDRGWPMLRKSTDPPQQPRARHDAADVRHFIRLAALGKAVLYSQPAEHADNAPGGVPHGLALEPPHPAPQAGRASVVLVDEIDKASRDFPNDLLAEMEALAFQMPEIGRRFEAARDPARRPLVVITSNSERELPEPFLRRCVYYHIPDPGPEQLARIVRARVLARSRLFAQGAPGGAAALPPLFAQLVRCFDDYRARTLRSATFTPGTSEMLDVARVVAAAPELRPDEPLADPANQAIVERAAAAVAKGKGDAEAFRRHVKSWTPPA